mmetsp:Transcript_22324/g.34236  ORF Transcript_22324/g.34236 Transcript_22324/m.34236 type:complete len:678 (+) Transcript_22324:1039-3072(+)
MDRCIPCGTFSIAFVARHVVLLSFIFAGGALSDTTASYLRGLELSCEGLLDQAKEKFLTITKNSKYYVKSQHCLGNIAAIQADFVLSGLYHGVAKAFDPAVQPPLAVMYMEGVECGHIGDIFWTSSFVKKQMFELFIADTLQDLDFGLDQPVPLTFNLTGLNERSLLTNADKEILMKSHLSLATQLEDSGFVKDANRHFEQAIALDPNDISLKLRALFIAPVIYDSVEHIGQTRCKLETGLDQLYDHSVEKGLSIESLDHISMPPTYYIPYQGFNDAPLMSKINRLYHAIFPNLSTVLPAQTEGKGREVGRKKIRVGFASQYFRNHSVCKLFCGLISGLDRNIFDVVIFSSSTVQDSYTEEVSEQSEFVPVEGFLLNNRHLASSKNLDIMVYPDIGMGDSFIWAHSRLANIQISLWGHPVTSGMPHIDYFISSDLFHNALTSQNEFTEQLVRMKSTSFYFRSPVLGFNRRNKDAYSFSGIGIPNNSKVFLVPQTLPKFHPAFDIIMHRLLSSNDKFYILIIYNKDKPIWMKRLQKRFARTSSFSDKLKFQPTVSNDEFFRILRSSTALLDPYPFGGGVTSLEAFSVCKAVVTLPSAQTVPHLTSGIIHKMDSLNITNALVATSYDDFLNKLIHLGEDDSFRRATEDLICERNSILFDDASSILEFNDLLKAFYTVHS